MTAAAQIAGVNRAEFYRLRQRDAAFATEWEEAAETGTALLEDEARRRAFEGVERAIYSQGVQVGTYRQYSDQLLMFLLKARRPEKYRDSAASVSVSSESQATIEVRFVDQYQLGSE